VGNKLQLCICKDNIKVGGITLYVEVVTVILLNVALTTINLTLYLQRHIPTYLSIYIFIRIIGIIQFLLVIFLSWYEKYGRKVGWIVKWYGKYGRKVSWIVKRYGKYRRKLWKDMKNMDEMWNDMENMEEK
jgi:hypothetical protein